MNRRRPFLLGALLLATLGALAVVAGLRWQRAAQHRELARAGVPPRPDLAGQPCAYLDRLAAAESAVRSGDDPVAALGELSRLYHANGAYAAAARCYETLLRVAGEEPRWGYRYACILAGYGQLADAVPLLRATVRSAPDYLPAHLRLGDALFKLNLPAEAVAAYEAVLQREPDNVYALFGLARLDVQARRWTQARARLETVVERTDHALGYDLLPAVYEQLGEAARAAAIRGRAKASGAYQEVGDAWIDELFDDCFDAYRLSIAAGAAQRRGDNNPAFRWIERAITLAPANATFPFQLGNFHRALRNTAQAQEQYRRSLAVDGAFSDAWLALIALTREQGNDTGADALLQQAAQACPTSPGVQLEVGRRLVKVGRIAEAIPRFRESIRLRPGEIDAYVSLASAHLQQNETDEAVRLLRQSLIVEPDNPTALTTLTLYSIDARDQPAARGWLQRCREQTRLPAAQLQRLAQRYRDTFGQAPW